jgi:hypothetical protein
MNTFEQDMAEAYKQLENNMETIASLFNFKSKGYMGENIMILDFNRKEFIEAHTLCATFNPIDSNVDAPSGWTTYEGIEFRPVLYSKNNRIVFTF